MFTGIDVLINNHFEVLRGKRVGLLTNHSAISKDYTHTFDILWNAGAVNLVALFSPEHGFLGAKAAGASVASQVDPRTNLPIHSLYGETLRPTSAF